MNHQMGQPSQGQYQGQMPQHQNVGQQRQAMSGQMPSMGIPGQQKTQTQSINHHTHLASFTIEKPRNANSWEDAVPEQQHISLHELQNDLHKFRRNHGNVKKLLNDISSQNCRRIINELVVDQNMELAKYNPAIQYRIASVVNKFQELRRSLGRPLRQLLRVDIILEAEPSAFQGPFAMKAGAGSTVVGGSQDFAKVKPPQQLPGYPTNQGQTMPQQQKMHSQYQPQPQLQAPYNMAPGQQSEQPRGNMPQHPSRGGPGPAVEVINPEYRRGEKAKARDPRNISDWSSESDESFEDDSEDSGLINIEVRQHTRDRSQHPQSSKSKKHRTQSKRGRSHSRSRSRGQARKTMYTENSGRKRRESITMDERHMRSHSKNPSNGNSPQFAHAKLSSQIPPNIHIHMNAANATEDRTRSGNVSPTDLYNEKMKAKKLHAAHDMSRESSGSSWDRASGTDSLNTSSVHTAEDSIFDKNMRRPSNQTQSHTRRRSIFGAKPQAMFGEPHPGPIYDDVEPRLAQKARYPRGPVGDYQYTPHIHSRMQEREHDSYFDEQPIYNPRPEAPFRRNSMAVPPHNPYLQSNFPPKPMRSSTYAPEIHDRKYKVPQQPQIEAEPAELVNLREIRDALEHIQEQKKADWRYRSLLNPMARRNSAAYYEHDEWYAKAPPAGTRREAYDRFA
ncbi:Med15 multi-domain protein [Pyrenophora tritici-repentis]|uniref:Med15 multi-domain protein n=1 Tax=Pyrenophora tritici-repentis TaxID=45151 RepID=A0A834RVR3_9PLEO|nr:Med15 multi-domain protein [Pyrenophora tritici-repentis]